MGISRPLHPTSCLIFFNYIYLRHLEYASATYRVAVRKPPRLHHVVVTVLVAFAFSVHIYPPSNEHDYSVNHFDSKHTIIYRLLKTLLKSSLEFGAHFFIQNATHSTTPLNHPSTSNLRHRNLQQPLQRWRRPRPYKCHRRARSRSRRPRLRHLPLLWAFRRATRKSPLNRIRPSQPSSLKLPHRHESRAHRERRIRL